MKKVFYTIALSAFITLAGKAQATDNSTHNKQQQEGVKATDNSGKTVAGEKAGQQQKAGTNEPSNGTRMAITEKGLPATKSKAKTEGKKEEKTETK